MLTLVAFTAPIATLNSTAAGARGGTSGRTWILSSMSIGLGAALLSTGTLSDDFGRRRTFVVGMPVLVLGSVFARRRARRRCVFVAARVVQGVGGAAVIASSLGIIAATYAARPRARRRQRRLGRQRRRRHRGRAAAVRRLDLVASWRMPTGCSRSRRSRSRSPRCGWCGVASAEPPARSTCPGWCCSPAG